MTITSEKIIRDEDDEALRIYSDQGRYIRRKEYPNGVADCVIVPSVEGNLEDLYEETDQEIGAASSDVADAILELGDLMSETEDAILELGDLLSEIAGETTDTSEGTESTTDEESEA